MEASSTAADHGSSIAAGDEPHAGEGGPTTQTSTQPEGEPTGDVFRGTEAGQEAVQEDDLVGAVHNLGRMSLPLEWRVAELSGVLSMQQLFHMSLTNVVRLRLQMLERIYLLRVSKGIFEVKVGLDFFARFAGTCNFRC